MMFRHIISIICHIYGTVVLIKLLLFSFLQTFVTSLDSNVQLLKEELDLKRKIRHGKRQLQFHKMSLFAVESTEKQMRRVPLNISSETDFNALSSTCEELANAQFLLQSCQDSPMSLDAKGVR